MDRRTLDDIIALTNRLLKGSGFECIESEWVPQEKALTLYLDCAGGMNLAACERSSTI